MTIDRRIDLLSKKPRVKLRSSTTTKVTKSAKKTANLKREKLYKNFLTSYKTVKTSLKSITKSDATVKIINDIVPRINRIVIHTYHYLKLYILHRFNENDEIPDINKEVIVQIMKIVSGYRSNRGAQMKCDTQTQYDCLLDFFEKHYSP